MAYRSLEAIMHEHKVGCFLTIYDSHSLFYSVHNCSQRGCFFFPVIALKEFEANDINVIQKYFSPRDVNSSVY